MSSRTRFTNGGVTITLDDGLAKWARSLLSAAETETVRVLETMAKEEEAKAEAAWYGTAGVTRRTGLSGDLDVITTLDASRSEVRVSLGSKDARRDASGKRRDLVPYYVHRPGPLSEINVPATMAEWWDSLSPEAKAKLDAKKKAGAYKKGNTGFRPTKLAPNPKASDGKTLIVELVRKPVQARIKAITPDLAKAIATRATKGG